MNKETLDLLDKAIKEKCIFGLEKCKTKDWTFEVNNNSLECINTTGDKIEFELLDKSGDLIKYRTYLKPVEDHSYVGSITINKKRSIIIKDGVYNLFKDIGVALDGINKLLDDYNGFEDVLEITKKKLEKELYPYAVEIIEGTVKNNQDVTLVVDKERRNSISKNHTATHMLHKALKEVLGNHVNQSGSYVDEQRLRFDFTHFSALTEEELKKVQNIVNENIMNVEKVDTKEMTIDEAKNSGATCLFDEKYGEVVRVVSVGDFSKELCGGTHVKNSGEIGLISIISESGVASGIRRIEAVTGKNAMEVMENKNSILKEIEKMFKCSEKDVIKKILAQGQQIKEKEKEISDLKAKLVQGAEDDIVNSAIDVKGIKLATASLKDLDANSLRDLGDKVRNKLGLGVVVLASEINGKVNLIVMATKNSLDKGVHSGKIIKEVAQVVNGGGGGRPDIAQAGGKTPEKIDEALQKAKEVLEKLVK